MFCQQEDVVSVLSTIDAVLVMQIDHGNPGPVQETGRRNVIRRAVLPDLSYHPISVGIAFPITHGDDLAAKPGRLYTGSKIGEKSG